MSERVSDELLKQNLAKVAEVIAGSGRVIMDAKTMESMVTELLAFRAVAPSPEALQRFVAESREAQMVPGDWECPKCRFIMSKQTFYMKGGTIGVSESNRTEPELCRNGCGTLERVTWRRAYERLHEASLTHVAKLREFEQAIGSVEVAREAVETLRKNEWTAERWCDSCLTYFNHRGNCPYASLLAKLPKGDGR